MSRVAAYRDAMLARKAAAAGLSVEEFMARAEAEYQRQREIYVLRTDRAAQWAAIAKRGNTWITWRAS